MKFARKSAIALASGAVALGIFMAVPAQAEDSSWGDDSSWGTSITKADSSWGIRPIP